MNRLNVGVESVGFLLSLFLRSPRMGKSGWKGESDHRHFTTWERISRNPRGRAKIKVTSFYTQHHSTFQSKQKQSLALSFKLKKTSRRTKKQSKKAKTLYSSFEVTTSLANSVTSYLRITLDFGFGKRTKLP